MGFFDFLKPKKQSNVIAEPTTPLPTFKYLRDPRVAFEPNSDKITCECCQKKPAWIYRNGIYAIKDAENFCPECIVSGKASKTFDGTFNEASDSPIDNPAARKELETRTPTLNTWQEVCWAACCNDYCQFIKFMTPEDFDSPEIVQSLEETYNEEEEGPPFEELAPICEESEEINLLLFQCPTCKKYYVKVDVD